MIWYLLYPFRGTTEAPILAREHPLRRALTRYAEHVARHVAATLVISTTLVALVVLPFPFLYSFEGRDGMSMLPGNYWTSARMLEVSPSVQPDIVVRSMWTFGDYGQALSNGFMGQAFPLHHALIGLEDGCIANQQGRTFGASATETIDIYSVIQYWNCSIENFNDQDSFRRAILAKQGASSPRLDSIVSSRHYRGRRLRSADALVSTVIHGTESSVSQGWTEAISRVASLNSDKWEMYTHSGQFQNSALFEFQKMPLSKLDSSLLWIAYSLIVAYFTLSLTRLKAVKSRSGLIATVVLQTFLSILSSLTLCASIEVDLSHIPRAVYPLVVVTMSLENIFRLINTVLLTPSEARPSHRVGYAFGESAPIAMMSTAHNLLALWVSSQVFSPAVASLCKFITFAMLFDIVYFSTFFLSVLSVDLRRLELSDALAKSAYRASRPSSVKMRGPVQWPDALIHGKIALSTRVAATLVLFGLLCFVQLHFSGFRIGSISGMLDFPNIATPVSWATLTRWENTPEIMRLINPRASRYVAKVMHPVSFVLKDSNRYRPKSWWLLSDALYDFVDRHLAAFFIAVLVVMAFVRILLDVLLWGETAHQYDNGEAAQEDLLSVRTFPGGHQLDVALMSASPDGKVVSAGLDRSIRVWDARTGAPDYSLAEKDRNCSDLFPVLALAINHDSSWLAILTPKKLITWDLAHQRWGPMVTVELEKQRPLGFFFGLSCGQVAPPAIVVRRDGSLVQIWADSGHVVTGVICSLPLVSVDMMVRKEKEKAEATEYSVLIVAASTRGDVFCASQESDGAWNSRLLSLDGEDGPVHQVLALPVINSILAVRSRTVDLIDSIELCALHRFVTGSIQYRSLQCCHSSQRRPRCGSTGIASLALVYTDADSGDCVVHTYLPPVAGETICFRNSNVPASNMCCPWPEVQQLTKHISNPGAWEVLPNGCIVGVRRKQNSKKPAAGSARADNGSFSTAAGGSGVSTVASGNGGGAVSCTAGSEGLGVMRLRMLRKDHHTRLHSAAAAATASSCTGSAQALSSNLATASSLGPGSSFTGTPSAVRQWEAWMISHLGRQEVYETRPLHVDEADGSCLMINELGPIAQAGASSIAVGFGNIVKLVTVGHETFQGPMDMLGTAGISTVAARRHRRMTSRAAVKEQ